MDADDPRKEPEVDEALARRVQIACDNHPLIPELHDGRLTWLKGEMEGAGMEVSLQTVQRWYHGVARPRPKKMTLLAKVLGVDESWLSSGKSVELDSAIDARKRRLVLEGSVNVVMGFVQLAGWQVALPEAKDRQDAHFMSIIRGRQHLVHVARGSQAKDTVRFHVPANPSDLVIIGLVETIGTSVSIFHFSAALVKKAGKVIGDYVEIKGLWENGDLVFKGAARVSPLPGFTSSLVD